MFKFVTYQSRLGELRTRSTVTWKPSKRELNLQFRMLPTQFFIYKNATASELDLYLPSSCHPCWACVHKEILHQPFHSSAMMPTLERHSASPSTRSTTHDMHLTPCSLSYLPPETRFWATSLGFTRDFLASAFKSRVFLTSNSP